MIKKLADKQDYGEDRGVDSDADIQITIPFDLAVELAKFVDCYAPLLREVARSCEEALNGKG